MPDGPPPLEKLQKVAELCLDPETGLGWLVYDPPLAGEVLMEARWLDDAEVEEALELDREGNLRFHTYEYPEGLVYRDGEWRSP